MFLWKRKLIGYCLIFYRIGESFSITDPRIYSTTNALFFKNRAPFSIYFLSQPETIKNKISNHPFTWSHSPSPASPPDQPQSDCPAAP